MEGGVVKTIWIVELLEILLGNDSRVLNQICGQGHVFRRPLVFGGKEGNLEGSRSEKKLLKAVSLYLLWGHYAICFCLLR
jgi:hypothetical protein